MPDGVRISEERTVVKKFCAILFSLLAFLQITVEYSMADEAQIRHPRFSPANDKLIFNYCRRDVHCKIGLYDLGSGGLSVYHAPENEVWSDANFSRDGSQLTLVVAPLVDNKRDLFGQIAIVNVDGSSFRKVTDSPNNFKFGPSFSPDGERIIYGRANKLRERGKTRVADYDVYEVEVKTGLERQLTNYRFYGLTAPFYLPDGKRFIFAGDSPTGDRKSGAERQKYRAEYKSNYQGNIVFISDRSNAELRPAFMNGEHSSAPHISLDGSKILFVSKTNKMDGIVGKYNFDLFLRTGGINKRLTRLETYMQDVTLSFDGTRIAFLSDKERNKNRTLWIMNSDGTGLREIKLPKEAKRIN